MACWAIFKHLSTPSSSPSARAAARRSSNCFGVIQISSASLIFSPSFTAARRAGLVIVHLLAPNDDPQALRSFIHDVLSFRLCFFQSVESSKSGRGAGLVSIEFPEQEVCVHH